MLPLFISLFTGMCCDEPCVVNMSQISAARIPEITSRELRGDYEKLKTNNTRIEEYVTEIPRLYNINVTGDSNMSWLIKGILLDIQSKSLSV